MIRRRRWLKVCMGLGLVLLVMSLATNLELTMVGQSIGNVELHAAQVQPKLQPSILSPIPLPLGNISKGNLSSLTSNTSSLTTLDFHRSRKNITEASDSRNIAVWSGQLPRVRRKEELTYKQLFQPDTNNMFYHEKKFIINHRNQCKSFPKGKKVLLSLVPSEPKHYFRRIVIRKTWANVSVSADYHFITIFVMGKQKTNTEEEAERWVAELALIEEENDKYNDIILGDFDEDYWNLTYKTQFGLTWAHFYCSKADYVLKIDDDVLMLQDRFLKLLATLPSSNLYGGLCLQKGKPHRNKKSKWYISKQEYRRDRYPPFCYGPSYLYSGDLVQPLFEATKRVPFFKLEDVYMGLCVENANKTVKSISGIQNTSPKYNYCNYKDLVLIHGIEPTRWSMYMRDIARRTPQNIICPKKRKVRTSKNQ